MNLYAAAAYMMHLLRASNTAGHGVHSPFMFRFITNVIGGRADMAITREVENLRREMLSDNRVVRVRDLGAGSAMMKGEERSIRRIASSAALPARDAALLARVAGNLDMISMRERRAVMLPVSHREEGFHCSTENWEEQQPERDRGISMDHDREKGTGKQPDREKGTGKQPDREQVPGKQPDQGSKTGNQSGQKYGTGKQREPSGSGHHQGQAIQPYPVILELGTSLGISTLAMALAAPDRRVISVEGCPELAAIARANLQKHGAINAEVICMEFSEALTHLSASGTRVEMAFIDGNHRGSALSEYFETIRRMGKEMIIVADDIRMNSDMSRMWQILTGEKNSATQDSSEERESFIRDHTVPGNHEVPGAVDGMADIRTQFLRESTPGTTGDQQSETEIRSNLLHGNTTGTHGKKGILSPAEAQPAPVSLETFRMGMLFFLRNLTPGHYRIRC